MATVEFKVTPDKIEQMAMEFLKNPPMSSGALTMLPVGAILALAQKAYRMGVDEERSRNTDSASVNSVAETQSRFAVLSSELGVKAS